MCPHRCHNAKGCTCEPSFITREHTHMNGCSFVAGHQLSIVTAERDTARNELADVKRDYAALRTAYQDKAALCERLELQIARIGSV